MNRRTLLQSIIGAAVAPEIPAIKNPVSLIDEVQMVKIPFNPPEYKGDFVWINIGGSKRKIEVVTYS